MVKTHKQSKADTHKIGLYIRVSTEEQAENPEGSIRNQEERLRATVKLKNMEGSFGEVVEVFIDRARSGKDTNRPELQRMLSFIRRKEINLVMVSELSRLSRSIKDFSEMWELMRTHNCGFHSLRENFDTTTAAGEMVLYTVANIAQFERRQVSERVTANLQARAARGLYNGGVLPIGYRLIPEKPGYLGVDDESAATVRAAFKAFLENETLSQAAKWLNQNGYTIKREIQGGNCKPRLGHFTVDNLYRIIRNRSYLGVRSYIVKGVEKETKAVWPALIDEDTFNRANIQLKANFCRKKPDSPNRWPYQLTGLVFCSVCGQRMVGKSAWGRNGKVGYYEHSWEPKKLSCTDVKPFDCKPFRLQAMKLEPAVWDEVSSYLTSPKAALELIKAAEVLHKKGLNNLASKQVTQKIRTLSEQIDVLAERLAQLPKTLSPTSIFKQMEKLEMQKAGEEVRLVELRRKEINRDIPTPFATYEELLLKLKKLADKPKSESTRGRIVRTLVHRIDILPEGFKLHLHAGRDYIEKKLVPGSNSLTNGGPCRT